MSSSEVIISEEKQSGSPQYLAEKRFLEKINKLETLDNYFKSIDQFFNEGMTDLAFLQFKNENYTYFLSSKSFEPGPALRLIEEERNENGTTRLNLIENKNNEVFFENDEEEFFYNDVQEEEIGLLKENELLKKLDPNLKIIRRFGVENVDPLLHQAQKKFICCLDNIIKLKNFLNNEKINEPYPSFIPSFLKKIKFVLIKKSSKKKRIAKFKNYRSL